ncbi:MAG: 4-(cytidine 5'-diphospho)-2-C-methyl-D-erythritol kinase [Thermoleophilia bacterium]|nr:4-(cytidine 5'-diphospho)-2-C-methyl-D-erythritol kinase [Thermoleophilia bacterium]
MRESIVCRAPAKVNLCLLVGPKDESGLHQIFTVFLPIDLHDEIEFCLETRPGRSKPGSLEVRSPVAPGDENLVAQALRALEQHTGYSFSGHVTIDKHIPEAAGLGGGSSDAGLALRVGARLIAEAGGPVLGRDELVDIARAVGADVAFFLDPRPAIARGVGEVLEPIALPTMGLVLVFADASLSTALVYRVYDSLGLGRPEPGFAARVELAAQRWGAATRVEDVAVLLENDLQEAAFRLIPSLATDREAIVEEGALGALMSGSGPTLFGVCESVAAAQDIADRLGERGLRALPLRVVY